MNLKIDAASLQSEIEALAAITDAEPPAVTRIVFSPADLKARAWLTERCQAAGLAVRQDAIGNTFARWSGSDPGAPVVGTGSHMDAIPNAGKYDGVVGVLGGLEAIRALQRAGFRPRHSVELVLLTSEEPTRFGIGCLGSRLLSGVLTAAAAAALHDSDGKSVDEVRRAAGFSGRLEDVRLPAGYFKAFVELHIEQGPILERENVPVGVVTKIAAPASGRIIVEGAGGHAGAVLMPERRDALCAASELILAIENAARTASPPGDAALDAAAPDAVATVGMCEVFPGAVNSIPSRVRLSLDVRDTNLARRDSVMQAIEKAARRIAASRNVPISTELLNADAPAECDPDVVAALGRACEMHGLPYQKMISRAYHDTLFISRIAPAAMLFIPCRNGYSHRPDEYASPEDIARGALVLAETLAGLSS